VTLETQRGWQCTCAIGAEGRECPHIEQAQVFRRMRGQKRADDTVEMEISAVDLQELSRAAAEDVPAPKRMNRPSLWRAAAAAAAVSVVISSGATYLAIAGAQPSRPAELDLAAPLAAVRPDAPPLAEAQVRFANPFDASEVFEFPPGTPESDARDAVAELLLKRARDRVGTPAGSADAASVAGGG
jgi:hypothetical protein